MKVMSKSRASGSILHLAKGDLIDVIAPSSRAPDSEVAAGIKYLEGLGFRVRVPHDFFKDHMFLANDDKARFSQLKKALQARDSKAIWCVRGGYGAGRIMPELVALKKPAREKALIGLSDVTALHIWLNCYWRWPSWHAPILSRLGSDRASEQERDSLQKVLLETRREVIFQNLKAFNSCAKAWAEDRSAAVIRARAIVGGNLTLVQTSLGTDWQIRAKNKILFLEDADERGFRLDRSLYHLKQVGVFKDVRAIVLGDFTGGTEVNGKNYVAQTLTEFFETLPRVPVFSGVPSGHGAIQMPVPFGVATEIHAQPKIHMASYLK